MFTIIYTAVHCHMAGDTDVSIASLLVDAALCSLFLYSYAVGRSNTDAN
jgi:hypothetical protein